MELRGTRFLSGKQHSKNCIGELGRVLKGISFNKELKTPSGKTNRKKNGFKSQHKPSGAAGGRRENGALKLLGLARGRQRV